MNAITLGRMPSATKPTPVIRRPAPSVPAPLLVPPLSAPAVRMPAADGSADSARATPRSLEQCAGAQRSSVAVVVPPEAREPMPVADQIVLVASALGGMALLGMHLAGWLL